MNLSSTSNSVNVQIKNQEDWTDQDFLNNRQQKLAQTPID